MKKFKLILCITLWILILWACLHKLAQGLHDENLISQMPQSTYDEIVDILTIRNGFHPSEHQVVTYYYERIKK